LPIERAYQVVLIGPGTAIHGDRLKDLIMTRVSELGVDLETALQFVGSGNLSTLSSTSPAMAVYLGGEAADGEDAVVFLQSASVPIQPVVASLDDYKKWTPPALHMVNGTAIDWASPDFTEVVNKVLENLSLLRRERRLFISYRRTESLAIAHQLRVAFDDAGYDTFLDLSSVPKGDDFQKVLWHRLLDSDVMIVLDTPNFLESQWTQEEVAKALSASVGMLRVVWPGVDRVRAAELAFPLQLTFDDFENKERLTDDATIRIVVQTEALRARNLAARHTNLVREFKREAEKIGIEVVLQPERFMLAKRGDRRIAVIPTVGFPDARRFHEAGLRFPVEGEAADEAILLYDHLGMHEEWSRFLDWLDDYLPVKGLRVTQTEQKLRSAA
jgi:hypothetical protein